jgi:hypothetical protein
MSKCKELIEKFNLDERYPLKNGETGKKMVGWVMWVSERDRNGIIMDKEGDPRGSNEFYFDESVVIPRSSFDKIKADMKVTFKPKRLDPDGMLVARDVKISK